MSGLMFPKTMTKKKRRKHGESILHEKNGTCYLCMLLYGDSTYHSNLHKHHVFGGANRKFSEEDGLTVWLDIAHHEYGPEAVHENIEIMRLLQKEAQRAYEKTHTREQFMIRYGRNFL